MKLLISNFLTCAVKTCKPSPASYPLHFRDAVLEHTDIQFDPAFIANMIPRVRWDAFGVNVQELGLEALMPGRREIEGVEESGFARSDGTAGKGRGVKEEEETQKGDEEEMDVDDTLLSPTTEETKGAVAAMTESEMEAVLSKLHKLLLETGVVEGKLVCGNCGFEYPIKDGVGNFLLPPHLV